VFRLSVWNLSTKQDYEGEMLQSVAMLFLTCTGLKNLALDLFFALQSLSAARYLPSSNDRGILRGDLLRFGSLAVSEDFDVNSVVPLLEQVIKRATDEDIWSAVFALVALRATPPTVINKAALDTPLKSTSSSQQGSEQTHDEIDPRILQEINSCVYRDAKGFYEKYFEGKPRVPWSDVEYDMREWLEIRERDGCTYLSTKLEPRRA
jgi:hypothetical protein